MVAPSTTSERRSAITGTDFGRGLRERRMRAGLSLSQFGALVHFSPSYLSRIEAGERPVGGRLAGACDRVLGADGALAALAPTRKLRPGTRPPREEAAQDDVLAPDYTAVPPRGHDDEDDLRHFVAHLTRLRGLAQRLPPALVMEQLVPSVRTLEVLARAALTPKGRLGYLETCAFYCDFAGWMSQEAGDAQAADRWIGRTELLAAEAGSAELADHALVRRAGLALYRGDAEAVVRLAVEAGRRSTASPRVRALAAYREAQGLALAGQASACASALDRGAELLERTSGGRPTRTGLFVGSASTSGRHGLISGWCLYDLGQPDEGAAAIAAELETFPMTSRRAWALFTARLALCHIAADDPSAAVRTVGDLLRESAGLSSHTVLSQQRLLAAQLRRHLGRPDLREVYLSLTTAGV
ncbi:helix-turn-helix domain-containing protein [Actinacidiphila alni]|uniref:helix-turn-helix domain-containing protein n=1 Tax=Actinacidiphila alni TaxID=380248 RepID=UPI003452170D